MLGCMHMLFDSFWRAVAYCLRPRVMLLSLLPLLLMGGLFLGLGYLYWTPAAEAVRLWLETATWLGSISAWLTSMGVVKLETVLAPLLLVVVLTPLIVVTSLLVVSVLMTPALTALVANRRFPALERLRGGTLVSSLWWSLTSALLALIALLVSVPLWLIPPLILVLPPLIWGWLTYRVMAFDALVEHASREERQEIFNRHRLQLLGIGVFCGYLGAAPSVMWASGVVFIAFAPLLVPMAIWVYTLVFAMSSLWFAHYCLAALKALRAERAVDRRAKPADLPAATPTPLNLEHDRP
jgi:Etoposide-induced protein 2.4 (EI24)